MGIKLLIRTLDSISPYTRALESLIGAKGNELIISTGFLYNSTVASRNDESVEKIASYINKKIKNEETFTLKLLYGYGTQTKIQASLFCTHIKALVPKGLKIECYSIKDENWHGKVCIKKDGEKNIGGIFGSSNFTPKSILENKDLFNIETDLYLLDKFEENNLKTFKITVDDLRSIEKEYREKIEENLKKYKKRGGEDVLYFKDEAIDIFLRTCWKLIGKYNKNEEIKEILKDMARMAKEIKRVKEILECATNDIIAEDIDDDTDLMIKSHIKQKIRELNGDDESSNYRREQYLKFLDIINKYNMYYDIRITGYTTKNLIDKMSELIEEIINSDRVEKIY